MKIQTLGMLLVICALMVVGVGCKPSAPESSDEHGHEHGDSDSHDEEHDHTAAHGGAIADWGGGKYHVEFTVDHSTKTATVYVSGSDPKTPSPVKTKDGTMLLTITEPPFQVVLTAQPLEGETDGASSRYVGIHESLGVEQEFAGSISGEVDGVPYAGDFSEEDEHGHEH